MTGWDELAGWWVSGYTDGADTEYEEHLIPILAAEMANCARVVDIGCGDGQIARRLAADGVEAIGVEPSVEMLAVARRRAGEVRYVRGSVDALPLAAASCDGVMLCLVLEHVDDLTAAVAEVGRVLAPAGRCGVFLNHPVTQAPGSGLIEDHIADPPERYWRLGPYLVESVDDEVLERDVVVRFHHRPLSRYVNTFAEHDLLLERMVEPAPLTSDAIAAAVPRSIYLRFRKS